MTECYFPDVPLVKHLLSLPEGPGLLLVLVDTTNWELCRFPVSSKVTRGKWHKPNRASRTCQLAVSMASRVRIGRCNQEKLNGHFRITRRQRHLTLEDHRESISGRRTSWSASLREGPVLGCGWSPRGRSLEKGSERLPWSSFLSVRVSYWRFAGKGLAVFLCVYGMRVFHTPLHGDIEAEVRGDCSK